MKFSQVILVAVFALVLSAGVVIGRLWVMVPATQTGMDDGFRGGPPDHDHDHGHGPDHGPPGHEPGRPPSWISDQLNLSAEQRQSMDAVWADTRQKVGKAMDNRRNLDHQREQAIRDMLSDSQKAQYDKILEDFQNHRAELDKMRETLMHDADERSRGLLDDSQKKTWDTLAQDWRRRRGPTTRRATSGPAFGMNVPPSQTTAPAGEN